MFLYALGKLLRAVLVVFLVSVLTFFALELTPGSVATSILGVGATSEAVSQLEQTLGLDRPAAVRFIEWLGNLLSGDLGNSDLTKLPIATTVMQAAFTTLQLVVLGVLLSLGFAVVAGALAARFPRGLIDRLGDGLTSMAIALPTFVIGPILAYLLAVQLGWFPVASYTPPSDGVEPWLRSIALPVFCLALGEFATFQRLLRADLIAVLQEPYIEAARARGLSERRILMLHAMRPAAIPAMTAVGLSVGRMLGGTIIVETLFGVPGLGRTLSTAILARDLDVLLVGVVLVAGAFVFINTFIDLAYGIVDPRVRLRATAS
ncbi:ABC transporter permease [Nocardioides sp. cx-169]|uniref:ABC transporter permease n=1 Tax=Nocardioides sp. cx-169 TaxID=2899080 RepID=UPI001E352838|nr:ABC transporter permease [Nocardioides sp. cx-169]MCD4536596.1 ABC transporter permease [Nocardioides sp. cx-169]